MKTTLEHMRRKAHHPFRGLLTVLVSVIVFLAVLVLLTILVRFIMM